MTTIRELLKETKPLPDTTKVTLQLHVPLGKVRVNAKTLSSMGVMKALLVRGDGSATKKAASTAKTAVKRQAPAAKTTPKATAKNSTKAGNGIKAAEKNVANADAPAKEGQPAKVTQASVIAALNAQHSTTQAIADAINASRIQVSKALSRYTQQGLIERTKPGQYALKQ